MKKRLLSPGAEVEVLAGIFKTGVVVDGKTMSTREAYLRTLQNASLRGVVDASIELQKIREACGAYTAPTGGYLVIPEEVTEDEFERMAYAQQAQFRDKESRDNGV